MRLFLGVSIPNESIKKIKTSIDAIKNEYPEFDWVPEQNYHLTIFFFGERSEDKIPDVIEGIEQTIFDLNPSQLSTSGLGLFVKKGINMHMSYERSKELEAIHNRIISVIGSQIPQKHDLFTPHTTIAKYKLPSKQQYFHLKKKIKKIAVDIKIPFETLHLYESVTKKPFPEYRIIHTFHLQ